MAQTVRIEEDEEDEAFLRRLVLPEEDRRRLSPTMPWTGGWRWFRSPNVVCPRTVAAEEARGRGGLMTMFTCLQCEQNYTVDVEMERCPLCDWGRARNVTKPTAEAAA
jgi:hypothetical protein